MLLDQAYVIWQGLPIDVQRQIGWQQFLQLGEKLQKQMLRDSQKKENSKRLTKYRILSQLGKLDDNDNDGDKDGVGGRSMFSR